MKKDDTWTGQGSFMDKDYMEGLGLKAILTVTSGSPHGENGYIIHGTAKLYIGHKYHCEVPFTLGLVDENPDRISMILSDHVYYGVWAGSLLGGEIVKH
jgi:hypothetical protein